MVLKLAKSQNVQLTAYLYIWKNASFNVLYIVKTYGQMQSFSYLAFQKHLQSYWLPRFESYPVFELWHTILSQFFSCVTGHSFSIFAAYLSAF